MVVVEQALALNITPELLGPGSEYEVRRNRLVQEYYPVYSAAAKLTAISNPEEAQQATEMGRVLQTALRETEQFFAPLKQQIDKFKGVVLDHERMLYKDLFEQKTRLGALLTMWNDQQERERQERERVAREEAQRKAHEEALARAIELESEGQTEAAEAVLDEPVFVPVVAQKDVLPKSKGQITKTTYKAVVFDFRALVKAVAEGRAPIQCLLPDQGFIDAQARSYKEGFSLPGCRLEAEKKTHFRS
jgi:hypothetical protein